MTVIVVAEAAALVSQAFDDVGHRSSHGSGGVSSGCFQEFVAFVSVMGEGVADDLAHLQALAVLGGHEPASASRAPIFSASSRP